MRNLISFFMLFFIAVFVIKYGRAERGLDFPIHDGKNRVINLSKKNFNRFLKKFDILVVYFTIPHDPNDHFASKQWELTEEMLELAAQITEREGVGFGVVDLEKDQKLAAKLNIFEAGSIYVYKSGHRVEYDGQRSTDVLVEFLLELDEYPVEEIGSKTEVAGFKKNDLTKVVGYFENPSSDAYDEFVDAALDFQPMIPFFAVFNKQIAKQLGLHELNQIDFYEPYMRKASAIPGDHPLDNTVIEKYVSDHKRATLRKLRPMDMYDVWERNRKSINNKEDEINDIHVVMFADDEDPEGFELSNNIKEVSQKNTDNTRLSIVWIDPDDFPLLHDYWESTFGVDLAEPQIGVVNVTDADSIWMEFKKSRLPTVEELDKWVNDVMSGKINTEDDDDDYNLEDDDEEDDEEDDVNSGTGNDDDDDDDDDDDEKSEL